MNEVPAGSIVVGVDGSEHAEPAVRWAAGLAAAEHRPLVLLQAPACDPDPVLGRAAGLVDAEVRPLLVRSPAEPRAALLEVSDRAGVLVVGSRGLGPLRTLVLGSTSQAVARSAHCPTVVVRHQPAATSYGVVVGIDGTDDSDGALRFAARTASAWGEPLLVVHCFWERTAEAHGIGPVSTEDEQRRVVAEQLAGLAEDHPDLVVRTVLTRGFADQQLLQQAVGKRLLVVGHRPVSPLQELVWGTLAPTVLEHAACDVAVVPARVPG